jgi:hypothetical protein
MKCLTVICQIVVAISSLFHGGSQANVINVESNWQGVLEGSRIDLKTTFSYDDSSYSTTKDDYATFYRFDTITRNWSIRYVDNNNFGAVETVSYQPVDANLFDFSLGFQINVRSDSRLGLADSFVLQTRYSGNQRIQPELRWDSASVYSSGPSTSGSSSLHKISPDGRILIDWNAVSNPGVFAPTYFDLRGIVRAPDPISWSARVSIPGSFLLLTVGMIRILQNRYRRKK